LGGLAWQVGVPVEWRFVRWVGTITYGGWHSELGWPHVEKSGRLYGGELGSVNGEWVGEPKDEMGDPQVTWHKHDELVNGGVLDVMVNGAWRQLNNEHGPNDEVAWLWHEF